MTEPKPIYNTLNDYELAMIRQKEKTANQTITINGQPLSMKQLQELIVSQSMTIDAALTRQGELVDALKRIAEYKKYKWKLLPHQNELLEEVVKIAEEVLK